MRWKFKRNIVIVTLFVFMFTFWGSLSFRKYNNVYADPLSASVVLSAGGGELLIAAAPYILGAAAIAGIGYLTYTGVKKISRSYLNWKRKGIESALTPTQVQTINNMASQWQANPDYVLDTSLIKDVLQNIGNGFTTKTDETMSNTINPLNTTYTNKMYDGMCAKTLTDTRTYLVNNYPFVAFDISCTRTLGFAYQALRGSGRFQFSETKTNDSFYPVVVSNNVGTFTNVLTGKQVQTKWRSMQIAPNIWESYGFSCVEESSTPGWFTNNFSNSYPDTTTRNNLSQVFQTTLGNAFPQYIGTACGEASICYYPPLVDTSKTQSVDVPSSIPLGSYDTARTKDVIDIPSDFAGSPTVSVPIDKPITDTSGSTPIDNTGFWTSLWEWLKKILDAILGLPGLIAGGIISALEALKTLVGNIGGIIQSIIDHILAIPDAISTKIDDWIKQKMNDPPGPPNIADLFKVLILILIALINLLLAAITFVFALRGIPANPDFFPTNVRLGIDWVKALNIPYFNLSFYNLILTVVFVLSLFKVIKTIRTSIYKNFG